MRSFFEYISHYQMASVGIRVIRKVRDDLYKHLLYLSSDFYSKGRTGDFLSRIMNDVGSIQGAITDVITDLIKQPFIILYNIPMVFLWGGKYALFAVMIFPIVAIPITLLGKSLRKVTKKMQERAADIIRQEIIQLLVGEAPLIPTHRNHLGEPFTDRSALHSCCHHREPPLTMT